MSLAKRVWIGFRLTNHVDEGLSGLLRGGDLAGKIDAGALHAFGGLETEGEAKAVDRGHGGFAGFERGAGGLCLIPAINS